VRSQELPSIQRGGKRRAAISLMKLGVVSRLVTNGMPKPAFGESLEGGVGGSGKKIGCWGLESPEADALLRLDDKLVKVVHFVRHGQGQHNVENKRSGKLRACLNASLFDATLTEQGIAEAKALRPLAEKIKPSIVLVSPLRRSLQTATLGFGMTSPPPRFIAREEIREVLGCEAEKRTPVRISSASYPMVDFSSISEEDPEPNTLIETPGHLKDRTRLFLKELSEREETNIAVVSHSLFLLSLFNCDIVECNSEYLKRFFNTAELKSAVLDFRSYARES